MNIHDFHHNSKAALAFAVQNITANTTTVGAIIDTQGFEALEFLLQSGTITDGAYALLIEHGNDAALADAATISSSFVMGNGDYALTEDDTPKRVGIYNFERYVRISIVSTGVTTGGTNFVAMAHLLGAKHQPVADQ